MRHEINQLRRQNEDRDQLIRELNENLVREQIEKLELRRQIEATTAQLASVVEKNK